MTRVLSNAKNNKLSAGDPSGESKLAALLHHLIKLCHKGQSRAKGTKKIRGYCTYCAFYRLFILACIVRLATTLDR